MLDSFLEVVHEKTKQAEAQTRLEEQLAKLPKSVLMKIASCGVFPTGSGGNGCWIDQFRDTPLLDQAIEIERADLEIQMEEAKVRQARNEFDASMPRWDEMDMKRQELQIKRKLLELEAAGGGQEGEDLDVPPDLEEAMPEEAAPPAGLNPRFTEEGNRGVDPAAAPPEAEEELAALQGEEGPPKAEKKPPTTKVTKETTEKPVPEKIDVKSAAARMRFSLAAQSVKEAQLVNGARPFQGEKVAGVVKATGSLGRGLQLLTGSRARALEGQAANRGKVLARNASTGDKVFKESVFHDLSGRGPHMASAVPEGKAQRMIHASEVGVSGARRGVGRATRESVKERVAVSGARKDAGKALLGAGAGVGSAVALSGRSKTAATGSGMASTVAAGSKKIRQAVDSVQAKVVKNNTPMFTRGQKLLAGGAATGTGIGALANRKEKTAGLAPERAEQIKEAFGAALMQGIKGIGQFAQTAGKSIAGAARTGGAQAAGQAAANAGRSGMMRAGNFMAQNPAAGAALVAAPAAAMGYAAGRQ